MSNIRWDRINMVCDHIEAHRKEFNMGKWIARAMPGGSTSEPVADFLRTGIAPRMECGMTACFGGELIILFPDEAESLLSKLGAENYLPSYRLMKVCCDLIGVSEEVGNQLFYKTSWPEPYCNMPDIRGLLDLVERAQREGSFDFLLKG